MTEGKKEIRDPTEFDKLDVIDTTIIKKLAKMNMQDKKWVLAIINSALEVK